MQRVVLFLSAILVLTGCSTAVSEQANPKKISVAYFSNLTHAQALIGRANGAFEKSFSGTQIDWKVFNAGPSVIEAMFAGELDLAYVGPSPAVNGYVKSDGDALRVVAGAASGGAALVVRLDGGIETAEQFKGKKIASPQLGNTQDVALRAWLGEQKIQLSQNGGDTEVLPINNADQLTLFIQKKIDAAWAVEPWVSRLVQEGGGRVFLNEKDLWPDGRYATTLIIAHRKFLEKYPHLVKKFLQTHIELTDWIHKNPQAAKQLFNQEFEKETSKKIKDSVLDSAFGQIDFTYDAMANSVQKQAASAHKAGFLKKQPDLVHLFDLRLLDEILAERKQASVK